MTRELVNYEYWPDGGWPGNPLGHDQTLPKNCWVQYDDNDSPPRVIKDPTTFTEEEKQIIALLDMVVTGAEFSKPHRIEWAGASHTVNKSRYPTGERESRTLRDYYLWVEEI